MATKWVVCCVIWLVHSTNGQGMFDFFGPGMTNTAGLFDFAGGFASPTTQADPAAREARITAAEEQMAEAMSETGKNSPQRQKIEALIHLSGGKFTGDAASLNYLVEEYMMTTPGPETTPKPQRRPSNKRGGRKGKGKMGGRKAGARKGGKGGRRGQQNQQRANTGQGRGQQQQRRGRGQGNQRGQQGRRGRQQQGANQWAQDQWASPPTVANGQGGQQQAWDQWGPTGPDPWAQQQQQRRQQQRGAAGSGRRRNQQRWGQGQQWSGGNAWDVQQPAPPQHQTPAQIAEQWTQASNQVALQPTPAPVQRGQSWKGRVQPTQQSQPQTTATQAQQPPPTFRKSTGSRSPAAQRLRSIQSRIDALQDQLLQAQTQQNTAKVNDLFGQMEALLSVKAILTGSPRSQPTPAPPVPAAPVQQQPAHSQDWASTWAPANNQVTAAQQGMQAGGHVDSSVIDMHALQQAAMAIAQSPVYQSSTMTHGGESTTWGGATPSPLLANPQVERLSTFGRIGGGRFLGFDNQGAMHTMHNQVLLNRKRKSSRWARNQAKASSLSQSGFDRGTMQFKTNMNVLSVKEMDALLKASGDPQAITSNGAPALPREGEIRTLGKSKYVYRDMDGFDTFQWVLSTQGPVTQKQGQAQGGQQSPNQSHQQQQQQLTGIQTLGQKSPRRRRRRLSARNRLNTGQIM